MEGKLRATWRVSLALVLLLGLVLLTPAPAAASSGQVEFVEVGSHPWQVPAGATSITVQAWGAGGAGGGSTNAGPFSARGGGGGGGGAYASSTRSVDPGGPIKPGDTLQVVVGAGGVGVAGGNGAAGKPSFVGPSSTDTTLAYVLAAGGSGGTANTAGGSPSGGAGGTIPNSRGQPTPIAGDDGESGGTCFTSCSGAGGRGAYGGGYGGAKLCGPYVTAAGNPGDPPGGGGGGGRTSQYNGTRAGGAGAHGKVVISWVSDIVPKYNLLVTWTPAEAGTAKDQTDDSPYAEGANVSVKAEPAADCEFVEWTSTAGAGIFDDATAEETTLTMPAEHVTVTAILRCEDEEKHNLTVASTAGGDVTIPDEGIFPYTAGTPVNLVATPDQGCYFVRWTANPPGAAGQFSPEFEASTTFTMPNYDVTVVAHFSCVPVATYTVTMAVAPPAAGTVTDTPGSPYPAGANVTISAVPIAGCSFVTWTAVPAVTFASSSATTTMFTMPAQNVVVTAIFECDCPTISFPTRNYDLADPGPVWTTINWNNGSVPVAVRHGEAYLEEDDDYTISYHSGTATLTILGTYLAGKLMTVEQSVELIVEFDDDDDCDARFTITAIDTSASICAFISPTERDYNIAAGHDVPTLITWLDSPKYIVSIRDDQAYQLVHGSDYTLLYYGDPMTATTARLTILDDYLATRLMAADQSVELTIRFVDPCYATLTITAVDEPIVVGFTGYPVNKLTVMAPWLVLFAALAAGTSLLALRRRRA